MVTLRFDKGMSPLLSTDPLGCLGHQLNGPLTALGVDGVPREADGAVLKLF